MEEEVASPLARHRSSDRDLSLTEPPPPNTSCGLSQQVLVNASYPGPAFLPDVQPPKCAECGQTISFHKSVPASSRPTAGMYLSSSDSDAVVMKVTKYRCLFILGGPGSGKGTQCDKLVTEFGYFHVNPGHLLRDEMAADSEIGRFVKPYVEAKQHVPGNTVTTLVKRWIERHPVGSTIVINGYPRTLQQSKEFEEMVGAVDGVVYFYLSNDALLEQRALEAGKYGTDMSVIRQRIADFYTYVVPVINLYRSRGKVMEVDAEMQREAVLEAVRDHMFPDGKAMLSRLTVDRTFRVLHFNVLASAFENEFPACPPPFRLFTYRMPKVVQLIRESRADICSIVEIDNLEKYGPRLASIGYTYHFCKKPSETSHDGTAILWNVGQGVKLVQGPFMEQYSGCGQFALLAKFDVRGHRLLVASTHLKAGRTEEFEAIRESQINQLLTNILPKYNEEGLCPVIVAGDFNSCPEGHGYTPRVYPAMSKSMRSAMKTLLGEETPLTTCKLRGTEVIAETIDYMFYPSVSVTPVRCLGPPSKEELRKVKGLPNKDFPSDHVQLVVDFMFNLVT
eukprot:PhF_6_TR26413/c0_g1_i4/m.38188/K00939/adk, AK; adenylate kinase